MRNHHRSLLTLGWLIAAGTCFQLGGCSSLGSYIAKLNPCGTILNCDPVEYRFISSNYQGPGADPKVDPACTYPPFCADDPFVRSTTTQ
jgi:hypothetical protein